MAKPKEVLIADNCGFCFGVSNAMQKALEAKKNYEQVFILGQLVHNNDVSDWLRKQAIEEIDTIEEIISKIKDKSKAVVVLRAHGEPPETYEKLEEENLNYIDATCPLVKEVHKKAEELAAKTERVVVVGKASHPEVIGILGYTKGKGIAVNNLEEIEKVPISNSIGVVAQTTQYDSVFKEVCSALLEKTKQLFIYNTICIASYLHRKGATEVAKKADIMLVIGGKHSSNTQKLAGICSKITKTYHIENANDISKDMLNEFSGKIIGITAGASTPDFSIKEVVEKLGFDPKSVDKRNLPSLEDLRKKWLKY